MNDLGQFGRKTAITMIIMISLILGGCLDGNENDGSITVEEPRQKMRDLVIEISEYSKDIDPGFIIITQNGNELLMSDADPELIDDYYTQNLDGAAQEDLHYGFNSDDSATPAGETAYLERFLDKALSTGLTVLVTDYCSSKENMDDSYAANHGKGYISFAANSRDLDSIPDHPSKPFSANNVNISSLDQIENFLYLIDPGSFDERDSYLEALRNTDYDLLVIDAFFDDTILTQQEVGSLKVKKSVGSRLVISYMSIGEAEDYRYYWDPAWKNSSPPWLEKENPEWEGNHKVRYWENDWKNIIINDEGSYVDRILDSGFDGVYLDIVDAFEYYE